MDLMSYPTMDALPFQHHNYHLFDCVDDETFEMEQLLAAAFDSSSSLELFQSSSEEDICFDPLYSDFFLDDMSDVFLPDDFFVHDKNAVFVADDHKSDVFVADDAQNDLFVADDHNNAVFVGADDKNAVFVADDHESDVVVADDHKNDIFVADGANSDVFVADDDKNGVFVADENDDVLFQENHFIPPHGYQLGNKLNHSENNFNKRQRMSQKDVYNKRPCYYNNHDSNTFFHGLLPPPPQFHFSIPPVFSHGISSNNKKKDEEESKILSSQSLSARQRRRKISEKTKELGKLVPGAQKMNTAEMFEAASSYIKFLDAQFAILQLMESSSSSSLTPADDEEGLKCLVASPLVQEKLYSNKKCLIPKALVESLETTTAAKTTDIRESQIQSNSQISKDL